MNMFSLTAIVSLAAAVSGVAWMLSYMRKSREKELAKSKTPFGEHMLRPPGESLRLKMARIEEEMSDKAFLLTGAALFPFIFSILSLGRTGWIYTAVWLITVVIASVVVWKIAVGLMKLGTELKDARFGFHGERYMAEQMLSLLRNGYRVFHDMEVNWLPEKRFNIDHVAVGPNGVFAIETKARRKPNGGNPDGSKNYGLKVVSGKIHFPTNVITDEQITQAQLNAEDLSRMLSKTLGENIPVIPILAFPGWWVDDDGSSDVLVISGKAIVSKVLGSGVPHPMDEAKIRRVAGLIDSKCRTVEG